MYYLPINSCTSQKNSNLLIKCQKRAVRIIQKAKYNALTQPIFASLNILPLPELFYHQKLHLIHAFIHNYVPNSFENLILLNNQVHVHNYIFRNDKDFFVPLANTEFLKRFLFFSFPLAWNNLLNNLKDISSKKLFSINLKQNLIQTCLNYQCNRQRGFKVYLKANKSRLCVGFMLSR